MVKKYSHTKNSYTVNAKRLLSLIGLLLNFYQKYLVGYCFFILPQIYLENPI